MKIDQSPAFSSGNKNTDWPWNAEIPYIPQTMPDGSAWPKISIVTPSYNQAEFIEETIRSVICQGYPNLEYIIIDGGSTDGSVEIIKKYEEYLTYWVSEPDQGQAHAINKGLRKTNGEIIAWINSDDTYLPNTFLRISKLFKDKSQRLVFGKAHYINDKSQIIGTYNSFPLPNGYQKFRYWRGWGIPQATVFFNKNLLDDYGYIDESYNYSFDYELFIRYSQHLQFTFLNEFFANYRIHEKSKTGDWEKNKKLFFSDCEIINSKYLEKIPHHFIKLTLDRLIIYPVSNIFKRIVEK